MLERGFSGFKKMGSFANNDALQKELDGELMDVGERLLRLRSSDDELLILLEEAESILARVPQDLPRSKAYALHPIMMAMITDELFGHIDVDIKVAVASCLNEITRITAPTFPYSDDQMKEIFQLFMVALKQLSSESGSNYVRAQQILETLATVRSCVVMLDIEIDAMIVEMFQLFFNTIRSIHSSDIFKYMETIMTIIIEESDEVPLELLRPLLDSVRKDNKEISPISWELGKIVFEKCMIKLQPYLREAMKHLDLQIGDYDEIVASLCEVTSNGQNMVAEEVRLSGDGVSKLDKISEAEQEDFTHQVKDRNGLDNQNPTENSAEIAQLKNNYATFDNEVVNIAEIVQSEKYPRAQRRKRGKKPNSLIRPEEGYRHTWTKGGQGSSKVSSDSNNKEKVLILALEPGDADMPSDFSQRKLGSDNKVTSDKRDRSKKQESTSRVLNSKGKDESLLSGRKKIRGEIISQKDESRDVADKMVESPMSKLAPKKEETPNRSNVEYGEEMVNLRIMVWWPLDKTSYAGTVEAFDPLTKKHKIKYDDDEEEVLNLREERWELFDEQPLKVQSSRKQEADYPSPAKEPVKKIAKRKAGSSKKQHAASSSKRSKSEGCSLIKPEDSAPGVILVKDEVEEDDKTCEAKCSLKVGNSRAGKKVSRARRKL